MRSRQMFIPLLRTGAAQADFGEERKAHYFVIDLPHSDDCFVMAFPAETTEALIEDLVRAFSHFGGVPTSIL